MALAWSTKSGAYWSVLDSLELLRQLGLVRTLLAAPRQLRALRG
jgi:hypothetical protein